MYCIMGKCIVAALVTTYGSVQINVLHHVGPRFSLRYKNSYRYHIPFSCNLFILEFILATLKALSANEMQSLYQSHVNTP